MGVEKSTTSRIHYCMAIDNELISDSGKGLPKMVSIESIRELYLRGGNSIRQISRMLGVSRQSAKKAIRGESERSDNMTRPWPCPVMDIHRDRILKRPEDDKGVPRNQHHPASQIIERLQKECKLKGTESMWSLKNPAYRALAPR